MDSTGWHAHRRAERESQLYSHVHRDAAGQYIPVENIAPMPDNFIGGFMPHQHAHGIPSPPLAQHEGHTHSKHGKAFTEGSGTAAAGHGKSPSMHSFQGVPSLSAGLVGAATGAASAAGGLKIQVPLSSTQDAQPTQSVPPSPLPPPLPPKDGLPYLSEPQDYKYGAKQLQQQYGFPSMPPTNQQLQGQQQHKPIPHSTDFGGIPAPLPPEPKDDPTGTNTSTTYNPTHSYMVSARQLTKMSAVDRSRVLRVARMEPHLQFMCGPLLKFDTIDEHGVWHGAAMIVTADSGSIYEPFPTLTYEWDPDRALPTTFSRFQTTAASSSNLNLTKVETRNGAANGQNQGTHAGGNSPPSAWNQLHGVPSFDLGPHPADPHSTLMPATPVAGSFVYPTTSNSSVTTGTSPTSSHHGSGSPPTSVTPNDSVPGLPMQTPVANYAIGGPNGHGALNASASPAHSEKVTGQELYVYGGPGGTFTFWRFMIRVPLGEREMGVRYCVNGGQKMEFFVPGKNTGMRLAAHSCNGFSAGVNPDDFRGPGFKSGYDPVWMDLLSKHAETPFHALVGGGDQLYCDVLMREPEMQEWVSKMKPEEKKAYPLTEEISLTIERFFFNHYCQHFRSGAFARANSSIPMLNMCDDHDLIDGFGSYPDDLQMAPVFRAVGARGYFFFLLFQCFINPEVDGVSDAPGKHVYKSMIIGPEPGPFIPLPSHSSLSRLGPKDYILMLDCRAERKKDQICSPGEYAKVFERLHALPPGVDHLIIQLGIPIAYPRMVFLESALESKFNPLVALGRNGTLGLGGFVNKFNADAELLDDLNDHWTARSHKKERNWLIEQLQNFSRTKGIRVTFISGDVHCAAVGLLKTLKQKGKPEPRPEDDWRYMQNIVTSAIVNTPPPNGVITMVSSLATKVHKTLHHIDTDEIMIPVFTHDPSGSPRKQKFIMGRRNWCRVDRDDSTGSLVFDIRVEREKGYGATVGYTTTVPPPAWGRA
ncbi:plasma membrane protein [Coprinopsis cinerea okayama7|uniref:Plasma membrane protein n=1 Tax=Coprinopsis cinerea (strain Okayama-7 / 130 / ATCC MYA-4618 / FGSC 9003) TaxID=240176 RepID=A8NH40_COPC7|nr:plasma membrane protein [Coprinopsis cinerea okayama7\|eukprot:XP_001833674.2 plasma membrane protein [Coprinopsis cinerea okayama7\